MKSYKNSSLKKYNTFGLSHRANTVLELEKESDISSLSSERLGKDYLIVGSGSNLLFTKTFEGTILKINIFGKTIVKETEDHVLLAVKAGEIWHDFVKWSIDNGYFGLENLALIPGTVGASPVQNIGAYGVEVKDFIEKVRVFDLFEDCWKWMKFKDCEFEYRNSHFKKNLGRYIVSEVVFKLNKTPNLNVSYGAIQSTLKSNGIDHPQALDIFNAVVEIRNSKLPDPSEIGNAGSFFKNPIVSTKFYQRLVELFPELVAYKVSDKEMKLAAGWLIEQAGWKGKTFEGFGVYPKQSLIIVNYHLTEGLLLKSLSEDIQKSVSSKFGVDLEPEVQIF